MGEGLLKQLLPALAISSAGLDPLEGYPADPDAVEVMLNHNVDISAHRARRMSAMLVSHSDLILTAELSHKRYIERAFVQARGKVFRIREFRDEDVIDPYKQGVRHFAVAYERILEGLLEWQSRIQKIG